MRRKAFQPSFVLTGLVGLLILVLSLCTNQPALAQTANPQFKIQESNFSNTILQGLKCCQEENLTARNLL